ncbi:MAG TPA: AI-2E family transporter [Acidimicrobiia bacterium]|nr:AI-2E family transporter [Acidimicrobiia bacterium]
MTDPSAPADDRVFIRRTLTVALVVLVVAGVLWLVFTLRSILFMIFVAVFVTVAFEPPVHFLSKRGWRRGSATGVVFGVAVVVAAVFVWALAPLFIQQFRRLVDSIPELVESTLTFAEDALGFDVSQVDPVEVGRNLLNSVQSLGGALFGGLVGLAASLVSFVFFATTVALFSFYMIAELPRLQRTVLSFMPETRQRRALHIWNVAVEKMGGYIYSRLILAALSAAVTTIVLGFLHVPFALSLGIWVGVLSQFVPVVGTYLASVLPALVALTFNGLGTALWTLLYFVAYQQVENYLISPRITKRTMEIHPAVSVAAIIIGGTLMGGIGVILALPMAGIIQAIVGERRNSYDVVLDDGGPVADT